MHDDFSSRTRTISRGDRSEFFSRSRIGSVLLEDTDKKGKFKRILSFLLVDKQKLSARKIDLNDFDQVFYTVELLSCFEMQTRQRSLQRIFRKAFYIMAREITVSKGNFCIYKCS